MNQVRTSRRRTRSRPLHREWHLVARDGETLVAGTALPEHFHLTRQGLEVIAGPFAP